MPISTRQTRWKNTERNSPALRSQRSPKRSRSSRRHTSHDEIHPGRRTRGRPRDKPHTLAATHCTLHREMSPPKTGYRMPTPCLGSPNLRGETPQSPPRRIRITTDRQHTKPHRQITWCRKPPGRAPLILVLPRHIRPETRPFHLSVSLHSTHCATRTHEALAIRQTSPLSWMRCTSGPVPHPMQMLAIQFG